MRNSTAVAARAIVMLACLIAIPTIAMFRGSLPEVASLVSKMFNSQRGGQQASSPSEDLGEAPPFDPSREAPPSFEAGRPDQNANQNVPLPNAPSVQPVWNGQDSLVQSEGGPYTPSRDALPVAYNTPMPVQPNTLPSGPVDSGVGSRSGSPSEAGGSPWPSVSQFPREYPDPLEGAQDPSREMVPVRIPNRSPNEGQMVAPPFSSTSPSMTGSEPYAGQSGAASSLPAPTRQPAGPLNSPNTAQLEGGTFVLIQERLNDLGAVYYRLESRGAGPRVYMFQCEMAVGGNQGLTRHFQATDSHPLLAMHKVLVEVEAWIASQ